jgi:hypothetical protein
MMHKKNSPGDAPGIDMPMVVFRMQMNKVEYTEVTERKSKNKIEQMIENGYNWMLRHLSTTQSRQSLPRRPSYNH